MNELSSDKVQELLTILNWEKAVALAFGILLLIVAVRFLKFVAFYFQEQFPGKRIQIAQMQAISSYIIYIVGSIYLLLSILQPTKEILLATLGSAAVAIGFSLKDLVASLIAGLILILDRPFQVGDRVTHEDTYGDVVSIGLRSIRVRTLDDSIVTIPNSKFINEAVKTGNAGALDMMVEMKFYFPQGLDFLAIKKNLYEITATSKYTFLKKGVYISFKEICLENKILMQASVKAYVIDTQFEKEFETEVTTKIQEWKSLSQNTLTQ